MVIKPYTILGLLMLSGFLSPLAFGSEWYEDVQCRINDPFSFNSQRAVLFPAAGLHLDGNPATGLLYAEIGAVEVAKIRGASNHLIVVASHHLTSSEAASYNKIFKGEGDRKIPWIVGAIGSLPTSVSSIVSVTVTLIDGLQRAGESGREISADTLAELMAANGSFDLSYEIVEDAEKHQFVNSSVVYRVKVGSEERSYVLASSSFALKVLQKAGS